MKAVKHSKGASMYYIVSGQLGDFVFYVQLNICGQMEKMSMQETEEPGPPRL